MTQYCHSHHKKTGSKEITGRVVLVGNPNVGKSVLFNALTGAYVTVSNYPGTSVEVSRGNAIIEERQWQVIDTPGMYSIHTITEEERVAREILLNERPDVVVHVLDARNLERMLSMTIQLIEAGLPVILVVNIMDEAERIGLKIDLELLKLRLGIPVIGAATVQKRGIDEIRQAIAGYCEERHAPENLLYGAVMERNIAEIADTLHGEYTFSRRALAILLLQRDDEIIARVRNTEGKRFDATADAVARVGFDRRESFHLDLSLERNKITGRMLYGVVIAPEKRVITMGERFSRWSVRPLTGIPIMFLALYFGLYQFVGDFGAGILVDLLENQLFIQRVNPWITELVNQTVPWEIIRELIVGEYGIITLGVRYAAGIILPIVATFFIFFSFLEDTGYFPRLALLVDRIFKRFGMTGRAVIPIVLGLGCATMATMVTRTLETARERLIATILLALAIPCSAQLGVVIGLLSKTPGAFKVWLACITLLFVVVGLLSARLTPGAPPIFYMELPPMRRPQFSNVMTKTYSRMQWYFLEILPLFILASVLLWLGKITGFFEKAVAALTPLMASLGLPKETAVAFLFGFFRRDYGAAGLYDLQTQGLMSPRQLTVAAVTLTLFIPCIAQFLVMKKERGWRVAGGIGLFVSAVAFGSGFILNKFLLLTGILT